MPSIGLDTTAKMIFRLFQRDAPIRHTSSQTIFSIFTHQIKNQSEWRADGDAAHTIHNEYDRVGHSGGAYYTRRFLATTNLDRARGKTRSFECHRSAPSFACGYNQTTTDSRRDVGGIPHTNCHSAPLLGSAGDPKYHQTRTPQRLSLIHI